MSHGAIYRSVQRLSQERLDALLQSLRAERQTRIEALRSFEDFEKKYVERLQREGFDPVAREIEYEPGLAPADSRLLLRELAAFDVMRRRKLAAERKKEAPDHGPVPNVSPELARSMPDLELKTTNRRLKATHDGLRSNRLRTYSESYEDDPDTDALEGPVAYYAAGNGASKSDDEISGLAIETLMPHEVQYLRSRIFVARELKRRNLPWRLS